MKSALEMTMYLTDRSGRKLGIVLPIREYKKILADLEELDAIREYDAAKASNDEAIPFQKAAAEIKDSRE